MEKYFALVLIFISINCHAQVITHFPVWSQLTISYNVNKKNTFSFAEQSRTKNITTFNSDFDFKHELNKHFDLNIGYRYSCKTQTNSYHRFHLDFSYTWKHKKIQVTDRFRYQKQFSVKPIDNYFRNKILFKYRKPKKITPELAAEIFFHSSYKFNQFEQYRIYAGGIYKLNSNLFVELNYILLREFNINYPSMDHMIFLNVEYKIPSMKKKKPS